MRIIIFLFFSVVLQNSFSQGVDDLLISNNWKLRKKGDSSWIENVSFPNSIHKILWDKGIIPNPYEGNNEKDLKWIEESDWEAETTINGKLNVNSIQQELIFSSLEPFTKVYLNGNYLFESNNAFKEYKFDITTLLQSEKNTLRLEFDSPTRRARELQSLNSVFLPYDERVYIRKPQYEFGWDWGPRFVKSGLKNSIILRSYLKNYTELKNVHYTIINLNKKIAEIKADVEIYSSIRFKTSITIDAKNIIYYSKIHPLEKGINKIELRFSIKNPELWWPNGKGEQVLYPLGVTIRNKKMQRVDGNYKSIALCQIKLIQEKDSIGKSFYFSINGKPVYLKGFNLIPESHISDYPSINEKYSVLINSLKEMNCNAVRIWGGGEYLSDEVMNEFQSAGIIVWQDFMFAGGMYPGDSTFLKNVEEEITYQVKRLRNYNNVALYCGNNEIDEAWHNWGWQKQYNYSKEDSTKIWNDYVKLFHELIPSIVKKYDPDTDYIPSSPEIGWGRKESMTQGDSHYWGVWWGKEPIETFEEKIPRFMSEFGMQAMPDLYTLRKVIPDSLMNLDSPEFKSHQKHPTGFETLNYYLEKYLKVPDNMEDYAYATQLLQAISLEKAIKAQRTSEKCMGTLIWQLNDTWPVTSWSIVDSEGKKKMGFEFVSESFSNGFQFLTEDSLNFYFNLFSENELVNQKFNLIIRNMNDSTLFQESTVNPINKGKNLIFTLSKEFFVNHDKTNCYAELIGPWYNSNKIHFFAPLNKVDFIKPQITIEALKNTKYNTVYTLHVTSNSTLHYFKFIDSNNYGTWNFTSSKWEKGKTYVIHLPTSNFPNEQAAIDYVKKNLKSINHLLGK